MSQKPGARRALALLTVVAAPAAMGLETLIRSLLFPRDFETIRAALSPLLTPVVWMVSGVALLAAFGGLLLQARLVKRAVARLSHARSGDPVEREKARTGAFMLAASVPQIPAILATFGFMFGASFLPVGVTMTISTLGVIAQVVRAFSIEG